MSQYEVGIFGHTLLCYIRSSPDRRNADHPAYYMRWPEFVIKTMSSAHM